jgi:hypothetical protein
MIESKFTTLGISGLAGSGKDLVADWFWKEKNFVKVAFSDPMKRFVHRLFNFPVKALWGPSEERNRSYSISDDWWYAALGALGDASNELLNSVMLLTDRVQGYLTLMDWFNKLRQENREIISTRVILQTMGTEWGRTLDPLMWTRYAHQVIRELKEQGLEYTQEAGVTTGKCGIPYNGAVIPDHRFLNEIQHTQQRGGYVIRVRRTSKKEEVVGVAGHASETEQRILPDDTFNLVLEFEEGIDRVYQRLEKAYEAREWEKNSELLL